ncbi:site-specific integrase [Nocardioides aestuarii]|uniref:Tyrosine-type recombinase/integrase n=1 Tax=Nocardioides aestuarii TaxID=252231 RepID=A0ABW4TMN5_9ACTN
MARPKKRRQYGTGSVHKRADGRWAGTIEAGLTASGTRRRLTVYGRTETECRDKLRERQRQVEAEGLPTTDGRTTVKKYAEHWLDARRTEVRNGPWSTDASAVKQWIVPTLGHKRLEDLTPADVRAVSTAQQKAGRSSSTRRRTHITLTAMLKAAMVDGHRVPARVLLVKAPEQAASTRDAMPAEHIEAVMRTAVEHLPHWSRWLVQVLYGQRPAEVLGLTDDALDFDRKVITIEWQLQALRYVDRADKSKGFVVRDGERVRHLVDAWHLTPPKTKKGFRVVPMLPIVEAALREWILVRGDSPHGLLWPAADGRPPRSSDDRDEWYALQATAGVGRPDGEPWSIYEARHGFATRLLEGDVDQKVVTELMGHSSIITSRGYQHVRTDQALLALERINADLVALPSSSA